MKTFNIVLTLVISFFLFGCMTKSQHEKIMQGEIARKIESERLNIIEKNIVVGCPIPEYKCEFRGNNYMPTRKLIECIALQKEIINNCRVHAESLEKEKNDAKVEVNVSVKTK